MTKEKTLWICKTAIMIALLIVLQFATSSLGQYVTGSCVNFVLAMSVFVGGIGTAVIVALISPFIAFLLGIGPAFILMVPCIAVANTVFVLLLAIIWKRLVSNGTKFKASAVSLVIAALAKFAFLYVLIVKMVLPSLGLAAKKVAVISAMFSYPQLITALIGGLIATIIASQISRLNIFTKENANKS